MQTIRRKESKHNTKGSYQITREEYKRARIEQRRTIKTTRKQSTKWQYDHPYQ